MRRKDRQITDMKEILGIVSRAKVLHLGLMDGAYPYIVPMHYGYEYAGGALVFYMHGALEGRKLDLLRADGHVFVELECDAALIPGGDVPCRYGAAYASVMGRGRGEIVTDGQEKIHGLALLMQNQTGRDFRFDDAMAAAVAVIKVTVSELTAKSRRAPDGGAAL